MKSCLNDSGETGRNYDYTATSIKCFVLHMKITKTEVPYKSKIGLIVTELCILEKLSFKNFDVMYIGIGQF